MGLLHVHDLDHREQDSDFGVFMAAVDEKLTERRGDDWAFTHRPGLHWAVYPCEQIWIGDYAGLVEAIESGSFTDLGDRVEHLDRLFFVRRRNGQTDEPRSAADLLALDRPPVGRWHAVLADDPRQAFMHVRDHTGKGLSERRGGCPACFARTRGVFSNPDEVLALARAELVETGPRG
jgi:hypothetical protein